MNKNYLILKNSKNKVYTPKPLKWVVLGRLSNHQEQKFETNLKKENRSLKMWLIRIEKLY